MTVGGKRRALTHRERESLFYLEANTRTHTYEKKECVEQR